MGTCKAITLFSILFVFFVAFCIVYKKTKNHFGTEQMSERIVASMLVSLLVAAVFAGSILIIVRLCIM